MQLNPARGRKHKQLALLRCRIHQTVYAAQPREGTETRRSRCLLVTRCRSGFMQLNPARGRKLLTIPRPMRISMIAVYAAQPREGTETAHSSPSRLSGRSSRFMQLTPARGRKRAHAPLSGHGAALDLYAHDDTPPCSSPVAASHAQHISSFLMGGLW